MTLKLSVVAKASVSMGLNLAAMLCEVSRVQKTLVIIVVAIQLVNL